MKERSEVVERWGLRTALLACGLLLPTGASARGSCPQGMWSTQGSCCDVGYEYVPSKNECMVSRPERRCLAGHLDDCVQAGRELENEGGMGANYAAELYRYACEEGYAPACRGLGGMYRAGRGLDRDEQRGRDLYEQACLGGDAPACTQVARWLLEVPIQANEALPLLVQACHRGDPQGCAEYAGQLALVPGERATAGAYLERACVGGVGSACRSLLEQERKANEVAPDRERELLQRACGASDASDAEACTRLGDAYRDGLIAPQSSSNAAQYYLLACDAGDVDGCMRLAEVTVEGDGVRRDLGRAAELYTRMCGAGVPLACERKAWVEAERRREVLGSVR